MYGSTQQPKRKEICPKCRGTGKVMKNDLWNWGWKPCEPCKGSGWIEIPIIPDIQTQRTPFRA